jgi:cytochrome c
VPSIGVSNLVRLQGTGFPLWKDDLLVGSLHGKSLYRIHLDSHRVVFAEPIEIGERIRDLIEGPDGRLVLWTDSAKLLSLQPAASSSGAALFAARCGGCHKAIDGVSHTYGPDLWHVVGRRAASAKGYGSYSTAMRTIEQPWNRSTLDAFLADPQQAVPGTTMTFKGIEDPAERSAIIEYLARPD